MRKSILFLACLCISAIAALAQNSDEEIIVRLSDEQTQEIISSQPDANTFYRIVITKGETNDKGDTEVTMEVDNRSESNYLWLFGRSMDKDQLRRDWHIVFDKSQKNQVRVEKYSTGENSLTQDISLPPYEHKSHTIIIKDGEERTCVLPIYYVKERKSRFSRWKILGCETKILKISIESSFIIDENYDRVQRQCDSLINVINHVEFCKHKQHRTSIEKQEEPYKDAIDDLEEEINTIIDRNHWPTSNQNYINYNELIAKLDNIDLQDREVEDCGNKNMHTTPHECKYCSNDFKTLVSLLQGYYIKKDNGETLTQKEIKEVKMIYTCCKSGRHASGWKKGADGYKERIEEYYKAIMKP